MKDNTPSKDMALVSQSASPHELATAGAAAQAMATVQARYIMADQRPRNVERFRAGVLADCRRVGFAEGVVYRMKRGGQTIVGPTIRFAEAVARHFGNLDCGSVAIYEDEEKIVLRGYATDLETNASFQKDFVVEKTVERKAVPKGGSALRERVKSNGDKVYVMRAGVDDMRVKIGAEEARVVRNLILKLAPADVVEEALKVARETVMRGIEEDPRRAVRAMVDGFSALRVSVDDLEDFLGGPLDGASPRDIDALRGAYVAVKGGETTWREFLQEAKEAKSARTAKKKPAPRPAAEPDGTIVDGATGEVLDQSPPPVAASAAETLAAARGGEDASPPPMKKSDFLRAVKDLGLSTDEALYELDRTQKFGDVKKVGDIPAERLPEAIASLRALVGGES